ncbi:MAG: hypothetical protein CVU97_02870 [Firmicutes bacterium HGW-Firmicutes-21]|nr:MAG: hypothetical protein CVU97_02870 [Firmicutes bacterium HGW-Firmicutes-21]
MKRHVKITAVILSVFMLMGMLPISGIAFGATDSKLIITHIDANCSQEGSAVILTPLSGETVAGKTTDFAWWSLLTFEWDEGDYCYKLTKSQTTGGTAKKTTEIPENGFVYAINTGNNYPALYEASNPKNEAYANKPNYQTANVLNSRTYAHTLSIGAKAYVYNTDIANGVIDANGADWYRPEFVSNSYIKIGTPDATGTPYDPNEAEAILFQYTLDVTHINTAEYEIGMSILFTRAYGTEIFGGGGTAKYQWWKTAIFEWDHIQSCYVVSSTSLVRDNNSAKQAIIPQNGFVIAVVQGTGTDSTLGNIDKLKVGTKAFVYGADLGAGTITASVKVCVNIPDTALTPYTPTLSGTRLAAPILTNMTEKRTLATDTGFTVQWAAVEGATGYVVNINNSTYIPDGLLVVKETAVTGTSYAITSDKLVAGNNYTVSVYATGEGKAPSMLSRARLAVISEEAFTSNLRNKTIVAFGDSLTARTGWVNLLGGRFGSDIINSGVGGDSSNAGRGRFIKDVLDKNADIVIINFGMNDQAQSSSKNKPNVPLEDYTANLEFFAKTLTEANIDVVFVTPNAVCSEAGYYVAGAYGLNYATDNLLDFSEAMRKVAIKYGCGLVDINYECNFEDLKQFVLAGDGLHQSAYGHQRYADLIGDYLAAVYDDKNLSTVEVKYTDTQGAEIADAITLKGAVGARILVPGAEISGYTLNTADTGYTFTASAGSITLEYTMEVVIPGTIELIDNSGFTIDGAFIYLNADQLSSETVLSKISTSGVICTPKSGSFVGTGSKLQLKDGDIVVSELTVIVLGDCSGDGRVNSVDFLLVKRHFLGTYTLADEFLTAGDVDNSGGITGADFLKIKRYFLGTFNIYS